ncbi:MAG: LacI family DNA-binding transcriptional regulator [Phycisphaerae bacterium]|nr:LacI family DNA-binding transcriptional regulator [Phycisphaerae bacterium]
MSSLQEIADRTGVSVGIVSRALTGKNKASWKRVQNRDKMIRKVARELGFRPHAAARAMRQGKFRRIAGVVVQYGTTNECSSPHNGYFDPAINELARRDYSLVWEPLHIDYNTRKFVEPPRLFSELAVDGVLALPVIGQVPHQVDEQLEKLGVPTVWLNRNPEEACWCVNCDEAAHAKMLVRHLVELGHTRIGYLGYENVHYAMRQRYASIVEEVRAAGLDTSHIRQVADHSELIVAMGMMLNASRPVTALICFNGITFNTAMYLASEKGISVPRDLSLCSFMSAWERVGMPYEITGVCLPEPVMSRTAVEVLMDLTEGKIPISATRRFTGAFQRGRTTAPPKESN